jgi:hypothetical protein
MRSLKSLGVNRARWELEASIAIPTGGHKSVAEIETPKPSTTAKQRSQGSRKAAELAMRVTLGMVE